MIGAYSGRSTETVKDAAPYRLKRSSFRPALRYVAAFWIVGLVLGSLLPFRIKVAIGTTSQLHRPLHMFAFGSATFLYLLLSRNRYEKLAVCALMIAIAVVLELVEFRLTYHPKYSVFEWRDVLDDSYGIITAAAAFILLNRPGKQT